MVLCILKRSPGFGILFGEKMNFHCFLCTMHVLPLFIAFLCFFEINIIEVICRLFLLVPYFPPLSPTISEFVGDSAK